MCFHLRSLAAFVAVVLVVLSMSVIPALGGPVSVVTQVRSVHVAIPSIVAAEPAVDETISAPDNSPFNEALDRTLNQLEQVNHSRATQNSSFVNASNVFTATAAGETRYSATGLSGIVFSESNFEIQFQIDEPRSYTIDGSGSFVDTGGGASNFAATLTGPGGTVASFTKADFNPNNNDGAVVTPTFSTSGTLDAGLYTLTALSGVSGGTNSTEIQASYNLTFTAIDRTEVMIPLPAGLAPGAMLLAALGAIGMRKRLLAMH